jgi:putative thioredoxin
MIDITLQNLETELIAASSVQPILLDIWAPWCGPCKTLGPMLETLEVAYGGRFVLAKLNADEQPEIAGQLSQLFGVRSIPFCVMFKDGQPVDGFVGAVPEAEIRQFLDKHVPSSEEVAAEEDANEAEALLAEGDTASALTKLQEAVAINPGNDSVRCDYLQALLREGRVADARLAFEPVASKVMFDARLAACGHWLQACEQAPALPAVDLLTASITTNKRDFDARFALAQRALAAQQFTVAMDELLEILMREKTWKDELARKTYVAILELMTPAPSIKPGAKTAPAAAAPAKGALEITGKVDTAPADPVIDSYRRKLSMALF